MWKGRILDMLRLAFKKGMKKETRFDEQLAYSGSEARGRSGSASPVLSTTPSLTLSPAVSSRSGSNVSVDL